MIPIFRIFLALSALLILLRHEARPQYQTSILIVVLALYILFSIWIYIRTRRDDGNMASFISWAHWIDAGWCLALISLNRSTDNLYFIGLMFPIFEASFQWGFISGMRVTIVSGLAFAAIMAAALPEFKAALEVPLVLARPVFLFGLGYIMAHWGESEITLRRRFQLISKLTGYANPRFGIDRTIAFILEQLKDFYGADSSLMILSDSDGKGFRLQRSGILGAQGRPQFDPIEPELAHRLLELSPEHAAVHNAKSEGWWHFGKCGRLLDITFRRIQKVESSTFDSLATILDARSFVSVPVSFRGECSGRLYVVAHSPVFVLSDMEFLVEILHHVGPIIENIRLVEQLASHAADEERRKIARDIHDSVIQPYIGLQMGLAGIREKTEQHIPQLSKQIDRLMELAETGIKDLRRYVKGLKMEESDGGLVPAMRRFAATFSEATGIAVEIETEGNVTANERLAAEAFQMMTEGLSNIRKHTQSVRAKVRVICRLGHLILEITNEKSKGMAIPFFTPTSITERTAVLGGKVRVTTLPGGGSSVIVDIPL